MGRTNLDERQLQKKHKAGNQAFMLLAFLLLADMGLQNYGIHWLEYPLSNYVIFLVGWAPTWYGLSGMILCRTGQRKSDG